MLGHVLHTPPHVTPEQQTRTPLSMLRSSAALTLNPKVLPVDRFSATSRSPSVPSGQLPLTQTIISSSVAGLALADTFEKSPGSGPLTTRGLPLFSLSERAALSNLYPPAPFETRCR